MEGRSWRRDMAGLGRIGIEGARLKGPWEDSAVPRCQSGANEIYVCSVRGAWSIAWRERAFEIHRFEDA